MFNNFEKLTFITIMEVSPMKRVFFKIWFKLVAKRDEVQDLQD